MTQNNEHKHPYSAIQPSGLLNCALACLLCLLLAQVVRDLKLYIKTGGLVGVETNIRE